MCSFRGYQGNIRRIFFLTGISFHGGSVSVLNSEPWGGGRPMSSPEDCTNPNQRFRLQAQGTTAWGVCECEGSVLMLVFESRLWQRLARRTWQKVMGEKRKNCSLCRLPLGKCRRKSKSPQNCGRLSCREITFLERKSIYFGFIHFSGLTAQCNSIHVEIPANLRRFPGQGCGFTSRDTRTRR